MTRERNDTERSEGMRAGSGGGQSKGKLLGGDRVKENCWGGGGVGMPVLGQYIISEYLWSETTTLQLTTLLLTYLWDSSVANSCGQEQKINNVNSFLYMTCTYRGLQIQLIS